MTSLQMFLANAVMVVTATVLFYVAINDLREYKIRNEIVIVIVCLYGAYAFVSGEWVRAYWNVGIGLLMFAFLLIFYARGWLGGGDVKILSAGFLWAGDRYALPFSLLLLLFSCLHVMAVKSGLMAARIVRGRTVLAFAPSVAAALIGVFVLKWSGF
jgi:prepilin peptidase CpaA